MSDIDTYPVTVNSDSIADHIQQISPTPFRVMFVGVVNKGTILTYINDIIIYLGNTSVFE